jgi:hypothetical protein
MLHHAARRVERLLKQHRLPNSFSPFPSSPSSPHLVKPPTPPPTQPLSPQPSSKQKQPPTDSQALQKPQSKLGPQKIRPTQAVNYMYGLALASVGEDVVNVLVGIAWRDAADMRRYRRASILFRFLCLLSITLSIISPSSLHHLSLISPSSLPHLSIYFHFFSAHSSKL